jgi:DNA-binding transcriptional LysR family regulator
MKSWMNLRSIEIFVATVEDDSMSRAAERLGLTQSAVSQAISALEHTLDCQLIDRSVRPSKLTLAGATFYRKATELLDRARELEQVVDLDLSKPLPLLRIGMVDSFAATAGPHLVRELDNIAAQWAVGSGVNDTSVRALLERRVDFMITTDDSHRQFDIAAFPIFEEPFFIVAPRRASSSGQTVDTLGAVSALIRYSPRSFIGRQVDAYLQRRSLTLQHRYELDTSDAVMAMVAAGIGWTITTPLVVLKSRPATSEVHYHPLSGRPMKRTLWLMARKTESVDLAERIAGAAKEALQKHCVPKILKMAPWMRPHFERAAG